MEYLFLIVSLAAIVFGANALVSGSVAVAVKLHVSDFIIGALVVGVGTSMPELVVSVMGAAWGNPDIAVGNIVGSNIFNVLAILGVTAAVSPVAVSRSNLRFELPLCIAVSILLLLLAYNFFMADPAVISRADGIVLLLLFAFFIIYSIRRDKKNAVGTPEVDGNGVSALNAVIKIVAGLAVLVAGCRFFVDNAVLIARKWGMDEAFISITLVAGGTSLPELAASIAAVAKKSSQLALGNVIGSNIFNILLILGLSSVVSPLGMGGITLVDFVVVAFSAMLPALLGLGGRISRWGGIFMLLCYIAYTVWLVLG